jgi:pSer/pThr/pTyr-binding forkhead associated (FHA) protein
MNALLVFLLRLIFMLLSYLFIGWVAYIIFMGLHEKGLGKKSKSIPAIRLQTEIDHEPVSKRFTIPEITIGRDPACDFPLNDDTISLRHSKLSFHHKQWWVEDLGSTNGSYVNETMLEEPVVLTKGDQLRLGRKLLTININSGENGENHE